MKVGRRPGTPRLETKGITHGNRGMQTIRTGADSSKPISHEAVIRRLDNTCTYNNRLLSRRGAPSVGNHNLLL